MTLDSCIRIVIIVVSLFSEAAMFFRIKQSGPRQYLQIVENSRAKGRVRQRVLTTLGRLDELRQAGHLDGLLASGARFAEHILLITAHRNGQVPTLTTQRIGPTLIFERLWQETGCQQIITQLLGARYFEFPVERAILLTVLHRLCATGSDRACQRWKEDYRIAGANEVELQHLYRTMGWLGQQLPAKQQQGSSKLVPRCTKDLIEEQLFARRRDLFSELDIVFFDTTSLYFEGAGGESLGQYGHSKDHRPDLHQMIVGVVLDQEGWPICCELWPGNTTDVGTLVPLVEGLGKRFGIQRVCIVADRGMIQAATVRALDEKGWPYILGARMRSRSEVRDEVLGRPGRFAKVFGPRKTAKDPSPLAVKEVWVSDRRYIVCFNEEQARKDAADRQAILAALKDRLQQGSKALIGNRGFRRYVKMQGDGFQIDPKRVETAARHDTTIRGHVFCSFLALLLRTELENRLAAKGHAEVEWAQVIRDLDRLEEVELEKDGKRLRLRTEAVGVTGKVFQAVGVALPPTLRHVA